MLYSKDSVTTEIRAQAERDAPKKRPAYTYRLVILNDCDAPETRMIALVRDAGERREWTYLSADQRFAGSQWLNWNPLRCPDETTDVETFGVKPVIVIRDGKHMIRVERVADGHATYPDGVPRKWQGHIGALSVVRPELVSALKRWSAHGTNAAPERTKVVSQASGQERVEPKQEINPSNGDEQP